MISSLVKKLMSLRVISVSREVQDTISTTENLNKRLVECSRCPHRNDKGECTKDGRPAKVVAWSRLFCPDKRW